MRPVRAYGCRLRDSKHETIVHERSAGKAKYQFLFMLDMCDVTFTDIRCRAIGPPVTTDRIHRIAVRRGVPFVVAGMRVQVCNDFGTIVDANDSANWQVLFDDGRVMNCHPTYEIVYFAADGTIIHDFRKEPMP